MNKKIIWIILAAIIIVGIIFLAKKTPKSVSPENQTGSIENVTKENLTNDLESATSSDVENELKDIDKELNNL